MSNIFQIVRQYPNQVATVFYRWGVMDAVTEENLALAIIRFGHGFSSDLLAEINSTSFFGEADKKEMQTQADKIFGTNDVQKIAKEEYLKGIEFGYSLLESRFKILLIVSVVSIAWLIILTIRANKS